MPNNRKMMFFLIFSLDFLQSYEKKRNQETFLKDYPYTTYNAKGYLPINPQLIVMRTNFADRLHLLVDSILVFRGSSIYKTLQRHRFFTKVLTFFVYLPVESQNNAQETLVKGWEKGGKG